MKIFSALLGMMFLTSALCAQTITENPGIGMSLCPYIKPVRVEATDTATLISFDVTFRPNNWIRIPVETYIQPSQGGPRLYVRRGEGIKVNEKFTMPASGHTTYTLNFPPVGPDVTRIDYGEDGGTWFIYDIQIRPQFFPDGLPKEYQGHWFDAVSGDWGLSLMDSTAVFRGQTWKLAEINLKKGKGSVKMFNKDRWLELLLRKNKDGSLMMGTSAGPLERYLSDRALAAGTAKPEAPYELPLFRIDSATYCGQIAGYTPRSGLTTMALYVNNIITGEQEQHIVRIAPDGSFSAIVPMYYPNSCFVRSDFYNGSIFLEPGKSLFHYLIPGTNNDLPLVYGATARTSTDLLRSRQGTRIYEAAQKKLQELTPELYKDFVLGLLKDRWASMDSFRNTYSDKSYQVVRLETQYDAVLCLMDYEMDLVSATTNAQNAAGNSTPQRPALTEKFYNFITNELANNPFAVLATPYRSLINRLAYLNLLRSNQSLTPLEVFSLVEESGHVLTEEEKVQQEVVRRYESMKDPEQELFNAVYGQSFRQMISKYSKEITQWYQDKEWTGEKNMKFLPEYLKSKDIQPDEQMLSTWEAYKALGQSPVALERQALQGQYTDALTSFLAKYKEMITSLQQEKITAQILERLQTVLKVEPGLASDLILTESSASKMVTNMDTLSQERLIRLQQKLKTPFIRTYVSALNEQTKKLLEAQKRGKGSAGNIVPDSPADQLFEAIIEKYRGKVVFVDFWATWCGPCLQGIKMIAPLKEEMAGKDVVFLYLTGPSSPLATWTNMIPDIKGEHYRLSNDQWNYLCNKFKVNGIPHYVLVGKDGSVLNPEMGHMENKALKAELEKRMKE